ncbi:hypothetical protein JB92DRAFT_3122885 [Gautieria morchelliformis]|nr:hypothetical protein JB92DRAFT_3122885 [Gautieria morchelliformis]
MGPASPRVHSLACMPAVSPAPEMAERGSSPILHDDDPEPLFSSTPSPPPATTLHERDPFLLTLMTLAKALYMHACVTPARVLPHVRGGGMLYMGKAERMIELVRNELHMAAVLGRDVPLHIDSFQHSEYPDIGSSNYNDGSDYLHGLHYTLCQVTHTSFLLASSPRHSLRALFSVPISSFQVQ